MKVSKLEYTILFFIFIVLYFTFQIHTSMYGHSELSYAPKYQGTFENKEEKVLVAISLYSALESPDTTLQSLHDSKYEAGVWIFRTFVDEIQVKNRIDKFPNVKYVNAENKTNIVHFVFDQFISSNYSLLLYISSFSILSTNWLDVLKRSLNKSNGVISLFGTKQNNSALCQDLLCYQTWLGIEGSVWRKHLAAKVLSETRKLEGNTNRNMEVWCLINSIPMQTVRETALTVIHSDGRKKSISQSQQENGNDKVNTDVEKVKPGPSSQIDERVHMCIAAVIRVRIYRDDKPELTAYEVEQWIRYVQYAGVEKVYLYDAYEREEEKLDVWTKQIFEPNEVIYHDWYFNRTYDIHSSQADAYRHAVEHYKEVCAWHLHMDMDEYPFVPEDTKKDFLKRLIRRVLATRPNCTELSFPNFLFIGYPTQKHWLIERIQRRIPKRANGLDKPLCFARLVKHVGLHHNKLKQGISVDIKPNVARINHYWGARTQNWKPDTAKTLSKTISDTSILPILEHLKNVTLFSNRMPMYVTNRFWNL